MIEVKNLSKKYGNHYAIKDLNFTIEDGKVYGFLGPNGAGKSTTMNIMTGYIAASEGTVLIDGHDIVKEPEEAKRNIGYLPEIPPLYQDMTVKEYLEFVVELKKVAKAERKAMVAEVMDKTFISDMSNRLIKNLSKGYKQRVGLAQAMLGNPKVIILDEPTVGLDPKQIIEIRDLIRELKNTSTVILSSHILSEVSEVCDHIMIISNGELKASDTTEKLIDSMSPKTKVIVDLMTDASKAQNILSAVAEVENINIEELDEKTVRAVITVEAGMDIREKVFGICADNQTPMLKLEIQENSLEDVFLEITSMENVENAETTDETENINSDDSQDEIDSNEETIVKEEEE